MSRILSRVAVGRPGVQIGTGKRLRDGIHVVVDDVAQQLAVNALAALLVLVRTGLEPVMVLYV